MQITIDLSDIIELEKQYPGNFLTAKVHEQYKERALKYERSIETIKNLQKILKSK